MPNRSGDIGLNCQNLGDISNTRSWIDHQRDIAVSYTSEITPCAYIMKISNTSNYNRRLAVYCII